MNVPVEMSKGTIVPIVLKLLSERSMYGYEIIREVDERSEHVFDWKEGTLYPWLHRLESEGLVESSWSVSSSGRRRKYYGITRRGMAALEERTGQWMALRDAVDAFLVDAIPHTEGAPA